LQPQMTQQRQMQSHIKPSKRLKRDMTDFMRQKQVKLP
jgi:hypothetical protein